MNQRQDNGGRISLYASSVTDWTPVGEEFVNSAKFIASGGQGLEGRAKEFLLQREES